jgi:hypothetical protein
MGNTPLLFILIQVIGIMRPDGNQNLIFKFLEVDTIGYSSKNSAIFCGGSLCQIPTILEILKY